MSTARSFGNMLNEYLTMDLMRNEMMKRDYVLNKVEKDDGWKGGTLPIPFEGQNATSIEFGQLAASTDISQYKYVRGSLTSQPEVWGSLIFNQRDLMEQDGKVPEKSFLKILPAQIDQFMDQLKMTVSVNLLSGVNFALLTVDGTAGGVIEVDRVDRFSIDQKLNLIDGNTPEATYYVIAIDINGGTLKKGAVTLSATKGGAAADVSAYTVAQGAAVRHPGATTGSFTSLKSQLLSAANGGSSTLFGQSKLAYPYLQAVQVDGSAVTASNIVAKIFDGYTQRQIQGKAGAAPEVLMSFKHFGSVIKVIEASKGAFNVVPNSRKASQYGFNEIEIGNVSGSMLKFVAIQEMPDDVIMYLDWDSITFYSNGMFKKRTAPDGKSWFEIRGTTGYQYIVDTCLFGDIVVKAPCKMAIMYGIPNY